MADETTEGNGEWFGILDILLAVLFLAVVVLIVWKLKRRKRDNQEVLKIPVIKPELGRALTRQQSILGNFVNRMSMRNKKVIVFYGSQTGTAEEFATRLSKDAARMGLPAMTFDPEDCRGWEDLSLLGKEIPGSFAIFCMATYGEGDPTDNAMEFYEWLKESTDDLNGLKYTVFGLGNKTYEHYNSMGKFVDEQLEKLGAERIYKRGEGDDDGNIEEDFVTWKEGLWASVAEYFKIDTSQATHVGREYVLTIHTDLPPAKVFTGEPNKLGSYANQKPPFNTKNPYLSEIKVNRELHKGGGRSCMHIEMDIANSKLSYVAGDHVAIFPCNDSSDVDRIGELLQVDLDTVFSLTNVDEEATKKHPFPCPTTYRTALLYYVDINSILRTHVLRELAEYATDQKEKEFILRITSPDSEGKREYSNWVVRSHRNLIAVLEDLPSFRPPIDHLLELLPRLQVRYYSISSSPKLHPRSVHITAVLVEYQVSTGRTVKGVATSWFQKLVPSGDSCPRVPVYVRHSSLRLPFRPINPVIMVGPGTGLAPFRGFIQERSTAIDENKKLGPTVLFFGCRRCSEDYIYQEELEDYHNKGVLSGLHVAFSRDQADKVYVQHKMLEAGEKIWELLENQGFFYVCGDARNMARDVQNALLSIIKEQGQKSDTEASEYVKKLQKRGRYLQDVWS